MGNIDDIVRKMRQHSSVFAWEDVVNYGYTGPYFEQDVRRVTIGHLADLIENEWKVMESELCQLRAAAVDDHRAIDQLNAALKFILECPLDSTMPQAAVLAVAQARQALGVKLQA